MRNSTCLLLGALMGCVAPSAEELEAGDKNVLPGLFELEVKEELACDRFASTRDYTEVDVTFADGAVTVHSNRIVIGTLSEAVAKYEAQGFFDPVSLELRAAEMRVEPTPLAFMLFARAPGGAWQQIAVQLIRDGDSYDTYESKSVFHEVVISRESTAWMATLDGTRYDLSTRDEHLFLTTRLDPSIDYELAVSVVPVESVIEAHRLGVSTKVYAQVSGRVYRWVNTVGSGTFHCRE